jgi:hypothetical protein
MVVNQRGARNVVAALLNGGLSYRASASHDCRAAPSPFSPPRPRHHLPWILVPAPTAFVCPHPPPVSATVIE